MRKNALGDYKYSTEGCEKKKKKKTKQLETNDLILKKFKERDGENIE